LVLFHGGFDTILSDENTNKRTAAVADSFHSLHPHTWQTGRATKCQRSEWRRYRAAGRRPCAGSPLACGPGLWQQIFGPLDGKSIWLTEQSSGVTRRTERFTVSSSTAEMRSSRETDDPAGILANDRTGVNRISVNFNRDRAMQQSYRDHEAVMVLDFYDQSLQSL